MLKYRKYYILVKRHLTSQFSKLWHFWTTIHSCHQMNNFHILHTSVEKKFLWSKIKYFDIFELYLTVSWTSINRRLLFLTITSIAGPTGLCHWNTTLTLSLQDKQTFKKVIHLLIKWRYEYFNRKWLRRDDNPQEFLWLKLCVKKDSVAARSSVLYYLWFQ